MITIKELNELFESSRLVLPAYNSSPIVGDSRFEQKKGVLYARSFYALSKFYTIMLKKHHMDHYILNCDYMYVQFNDMIIVDNKKSRGVSQLVFLNNDDTVCSILV